MPLTIACNDCGTPLDIASIRLLAEALRHHDCGYQPPAPSLPAQAPHDEPQAPRTRRRPRDGNDA